MEHDLTDIAVGIANFEATYYVTLRLQDSAGAVHEVFLTHDLASELSDALLDAAFAVSVSNARMN